MEYVRKEFLFQRLKFQRHWTPCILHLQLFLGFLQDFLECEIESEQPLH